MNRGIKNKIFLFTSGLFIVVLAILMVIQTFVIGEFFERRRLEAIEGASEELVFRSFESEDPEKDIYRLAAEFSMVQNTPFVVIDPEKNFFEQVHSPGNTLLVQTDDGRVFNLVVDGFDPEKLQRFDDGLWIEFSGFKMDEQNLRAFFIETQDIALDMESQKGDIPPEDFERMMSEFEDREVISSHGEIIFNNARNMESQAGQKLIGYHADQIEVFLMDHGIESFFDSDEMRVFDFEDEWAATKNRLLVRPVFFPGGKDYLLIAIVSTSNTESIVSIFREFYWVNFIIAIFISFVASYVFAGRFSRPVRKMESIARDMANMDFSRQIDISSNDEIGSLANSLNMLSKSLQEKILALEDANAKLLDDIEFKTRQEEIRKSFVANVSHELKTPLTIMKGLIEGMKEGLYKDASHLQSALEETQRMERLVFDMLEISKYEAKGIELDRTIFSLDESVNRVYRRFNGFAEKKKLKVDINLEEGFIDADQEKIEHVLENLISNAIRYCKTDGHLLISIRAEDKTLYFSIINDGDPIPDDSLESIWKPFYRVESSRNRQKGGTGLGLVIVKSILESHDADFGVVNTEDGVKFWFDIERITE